MSYPSFVTIISSFDFLYRSISIRQIAWNVEISEARRTVRSEYEEKLDDAYVSSSIDRICDDTCQSWLVVSTMQSMCRLPHIWTKAMKSND